MHPLNAILAKSGVSFFFRCASSESALLPYMLKVNAPNNKKAKTQATILFPSQSEHALAISNPENRSQLEVCSQNMKD